MSVAGGSNYESGDSTAMGGYVGGKIFTVQIPVIPETILPDD